MIGTTAWYRYVRGKRGAWARGGVRLLGWRLVRVLPGLMLVLVLVLVLMLVDARMWGPPHPSQAWGSLRVLLLLPEQTQMQLGLAVPPRDWQAPPHCCQLPHPLSYPAPHLLRPCQCRGPCPLLPDSLLHPQQQVNGPRGWRGVRPGRGTAEGSGSVCVGARGAYAPLLAPSAAVTCCPQCGSVACG